MILVIGLYFLFASTFVLAKEALLYAYPAFLIGIRMLMGGTLLVAYCLYRKTYSGQLNRNVLLLFAQVILFHIFLAYTLEFWALQYVTPAKAALLYNLSPFATAFLSYLLLNERLTSKQWLGLSVGFMSMAPILIAYTPVEDAVGHIGFFSWPELGLLCSVLCAAYGWLIVKKLVIDAHYSPIMVNGVGMIGGGTLALAWSFITHSGSVLREGHLDWVGATLKPLVGLQGAIVGGWLFYTILLVIIANIICYNLYAHLLRTYSATLLSFAGFTCPLWAAMLSWVFQGQPVNLAFGLSMIGVIVGLYLFYSDELRLKLA